LHEREDIVFYLCEAPSKEAGTVMLRQIGAREIIQAHAGRMPVWVVREVI